LQRGHRFLEQFRQRLGLQQTISPDNRSPQMKTPRYEHQRTSTHRIGV
jgi:hypothetical protein